MKKIVVFVIVIAGLTNICAARGLDDKLPIRGFSIEAPTHEGLETFMTFVKNELAPAKVNLLILRLNWSYAPKSHPELKDGERLTKKDVRKLRRLCKKYGIRLVPLLDLLGHQSLYNNNLGLLKAYPQFEEIPSEIDSKLRWPQPEGFYCKSYCPLHPDVHKVVFEVIDEICKLFKADTFHAGMDEVFYIGEADCPRCGGKDRAELFAGEVKAIHDHLEAKGIRMMMWADRLLDGRATGLGMWEASYIDTWRAIDMIPKDIFICNCHYGKAESSSLSFAQKGFDVVTGGFRLPDVCILQIKDMILFREQVDDDTKQNLCGYIHTIWNSAGYFVNRFYTDEEKDSESQELPNVGVEAAKVVLGYFRELARGEESANKHQTR